MERYLKPDRLDVDPNAGDADKQYKHWKKTFDNFLASLPEPQKLSILINFVSARIYEYISDIDTFEEAIEILEKTYVKPKNEVFARHVLSTTKQEPNESLDKFLNRLKSLAKDCNFVAVTAEKHQNDAIRDAFISGLTSIEIRQRLLEKETLDLQTAYDSARSLELAQKHSRTYQTNTPSQPCGATAAAANSDNEDILEPKSLNAISAKCYFCGYGKHPRFKCPAKDAVCKLCEKKGHFAKVCNSSKNTKVSAATQSVLATLNAAAGPFGLENAMIKILVNNKPLTALIDTGSSDSYISANIPQREKWSIFPSRQVINMASTTLTKETQGHCSVKLKYEDRIYRDFRLSVLPDLCADVILGHDFLNMHSKLSLSFSGNGAPFSVCGVAAAKIVAPSLFQNLTPDCKPVATKSRRQTPDNEKFITGEVKRLLHEGIIEPSSSPWRAQVLVTTNERHKKRLVVDYSQTINKHTYLDAYPLPNLEKMVEKISKYKYYSTLDLKSAYHQIPIQVKDKPFTAFEAAGRLYQFKRIPFGVTNGVASFQRIINSVIEKEHCEGAEAYVDNVTIGGYTKEEHDRNLRNFFEAAAKYNLTFNEDQSVICVEQLDLMGYRISQGLIRPDPERLKPLNEMPAPTTLKAQKRIVGMFSYYSNWIYQFSDKIRPLNQNTVFPLPDSVSKSFETLKEELGNAVLVTVDPRKPLTVETDASDVAISATLNQEGRPVAFFSRTLSPSECNHSPVEKEAYAIVESIKKWRHFLLNTHFKLLTDQESVSFIYGPKHSGKVKNEKIQRWKIELSCFSYDVVYRPGPENKAADALSRATCGASSPDALRELHDSLCHPGITRMFHFIRSRNLPYSIDNVKVMTANCNVCSEVKPNFFKPKNQKLIKATKPFERLSVDFKGPLPSVSRNKYMLTITDEYSRFPFAYPCADLSSTTVIKCFCQLFATFGMPDFVHSDRGTSFLSNELKTFLHSKGIATSRTTPYNPQCNGQVEKLNSTLWKAILLSLKSRGLETSQWEIVLPDVLHSIRSLLCTATNCTPHERMFQHTRRSTSGNSLPSWLLTPGPVYMKRNVRSSKFEPLVDEVELLSANPQYAHVRLQNGRETTVSLRQLAPTGEIVESPEDTGRPTDHEASNNMCNTPPPQVETNTRTDDTMCETIVETEPPDTTAVPDENDNQQPASPAPATAGVPDQPYTDTRGRYIRTRAYYPRSCKK